MCSEATHRVGSSGISIAFGSRIAKQTNEVGIGISKKQPLVCSEAVAKQQSGLRHEKSLNY